MIKTTVLEEKEISKPSLDLDYRSCLLQNRKPETELEKEQIKLISYSCFKDPKWVLKSLLLYWVLFAHICFADIISSNHILWIANLCCAAIEWGLIRLIYFSLKTFWGFISNLKK